MSGEEWQDGDTAKAFQASRDAAAVYGPTRRKAYEDYLATCHCPESVYGATYLGRPFCRLCTREIVGGARG